MLTWPCQGQVHDILRTEPHQAQAEGDVVLLCLVGHPVPGISIVLKVKNEVEEDDVEMLRLRYEAFIFGLL